MTLDELLAFAEAYLEPGHEGVVIGTCVELAAQIADAPVDTLSCGVIDYCVRWAEL